MPERSTTDKPRKIVVCHPDDFARVNAAVMSLGHGDVLVMPNRYVAAGTSYVMDAEAAPDPPTRWIRRVPPPFETLGGQL